LCEPKKTNIDGKDTVRAPNVPVICILNAALSSLQTGSRDSSVGTATCYWLEGPGSNPGGDEIFRIHPDRSRDSGLLPGVMQPGAWRWPHPVPSSGGSSACLACNGTAFTFTPLIYHLKPSRQCVYYQLSHSETLHQTVFMRFVRFSQETAIIFL
jgi:hypothetical protein